MGRMNNHAAERIARQRQNEADMRVSIAPPQFDSRMQPSSMQASDQPRHVQQDMTAKRARWHDQRWDLRVAYRLVRWIEGFTWLSIPRAIGDGVKFAAAIAIEYVFVVWRGHVSEATYKARWSRCRACPHMEKHVEKIVRVTIRGDARYAAVGRRTRRLCHGGKTRGCNCPTPTADLRLKIPLSNYGCPEGRFPRGETMKDQ